MIPSACLWKSTESKHRPALIIQSGGYRQIVTKTAFMTARRHKNGVKTAQSRFAQPPMELWAVEMG
jgi:hypothetical protein